MAGRPKIFDEKDVLAKAGLVFWENGYEGSSADDLLKAMGIGKGSFYLFFKGGKKELYEKALKQFAENLLADIRNDLAKSKDPIDFIKQFFLSMAEAEQELRIKGCFMGNALVEMSTKDEFTTKLISKLLSDLEAIFTEAIQQAKDSGRLTTTASAQSMGRYLLNLWNGLNVTRRMNGNAKELREIIKMNLVGLS